MELDRLPQHALYSFPGRPTGDAPPNIGGKGRETTGSFFHHNQNFHHPSLHPVHCSPFPPTPVPPFSRPPSPVSLPHPPTHPAIPPQHPNPPHLRIILQMQHHAIRPRRAQRVHHRVGIG